MTTTGDVELTVLDGGAGVVSVPASSLQVVIGPCSSGTAAQIVASRNANTLRSSLGYGPLVEAAALAVLAGGTVLALKAATVTAGYIKGGDSAAVNIASSTNATPIVVTTGAAHNLEDGDIITIASHLVNTSANGVWRIDVLSSTTFSLNDSVGVGIGGATGTVQDSGIYQSGTGTSEITVTGTPYDDFYFQLVVTTGGTIGTTGIKFKLSLDAGRNFGPTIALGTATTYAVADTGLTLAFSAGTLVALDAAQFSTVAPATDAASIQACLNALQASQYAVAGWGSMHIVGKYTGANATTFEGYLDTLAAGYIFTRAIIAARDASPPAGWGGSGESEATWQAAVALDYSAVSARRIDACAGYYNMPSAYPTTVCGSPRYRRPGSFAAAARQVAIPPQRHAGRVRDGALSNIVIDPTLDPADGFIYHDERLVPGFDAARFTSFRTRIGLPGVYMVNPNLMSPAGSVFSLLPLGSVMDIGCGIAHQVGQQEINEDIRLNDNGTIFENEAQAIESVMLGALNSQMVAKGMLSSAQVLVDRSNNIRATSTVNVAITLFSRGYVLQENITIGFASPFAAGG